MSQEIVTIYKPIVQPESDKVLPIIGHLTSVALTRTCLALSNLILMVWEDLHHVNDISYVFSHPCMIQLVVYSVIQISKSMHA